MQLDALSQWHTHENLHISYQLGTQPRAPSGISR
jgi:hypothetical protein